MAVDWMMFVAAGFAGTAVGLALVAVWFVARRRSRSDEDE